MPERIRSGGNSYIIRSMGAKLSSTNRYLKDPALRGKLILVSVASSSAIEGIRAPFLKKRTKSVAGASAKRTLKR